MASTEKYTSQQIEEFYEWNADIETSSLLTWIIELLPQTTFDDYMTDIDNENKAHDQK